MQMTKVCFDDDCYIVASVQDTVDADRIDESATIRRAEQARRLRRPLDERLDRETVVVSVQRHIPDLNAPEQE